MPGGATGLQSVKSDLWGSSRAVRHAIYTAGHNEASKKRLVLQSLKNKLVDEKSLDRPGQGLTSNFLFSMRSQKGGICLLKPLPCSVQSIPADAGSTMLMAFRALLFDPLIFRCPKPSLCGVLTDKRRVFHEGKKSDGRKTSEGESTGGEKTRAGGLASTPADRGKALAPKKQGRREIMARECVYETAVAYCIFDRDARKRIHWIPKKRVVEIER